MPYGWDDEKFTSSAGPAPRPPAPVGINSAPVGRPAVSAGLYSASGQPASGGAYSPAPRPHFTRPPVADPSATDVSRPSRWLGPPVHGGPPPPPKGTGGIRPADGGGRWDGLGPPQIIGPGPTPAGGRETKPKIIGPGPTPVDRGGGYLGPPIPPGDPSESQWDRPKRLPPQDPPDWTPWDDAGGGPGGDPPPPPPLQIPRKTGGSLPRNPGDDDMPPRTPPEQSFASGPQLADSGGALTPAGRDAWRRAYQTSHARFGRYPGIGQIPPPIQPGSASFNPHDGTWS